MSDKTPIPQPDNQADSILSSENKVDVMGSALIIHLNEKVAAGVADDFLMQRIKPIMLQQEEQVGVGFNMTPGAINTMDLDDYTHGLGAFMKLMSDPEVRKKSKGVAIIHPGSEEEPTSFVERIKKNFSPEQILISMIEGAKKFPKLKDLRIERFHTLPEALEWFESLDGTSEIIIENP